MKVKDLPLVLQEILVKSSFLRRALKRAEVLRDEIDKLALKYLEKDKEDEK